jgi:hypothetical protein
MQSPPSAGLRVGEVIMCNRRRVQHPEACRSLMTPEAGIKRDRTSKEEFKFATATRYYGSIGQQENGQDERSADSGRAGTQNTRITQRNLTRTGSVRQGDMCIEDSGINANIEGASTGGGDECRRHLPNHMTGVTAGRRGSFFPTQQRD